jgi:hypothetical protein
MLALQPRVHAPIVIETLLFAGIGWQREQTPRAGEEGREVYRRLGVGQRCFRVTQIQNQISAMFVHVMRAHQRFPRFIISCDLVSALQSPPERAAESFKSALTAAIDADTYHSKVVKWRATGLVLPHLLAPNVLL